MSSLLLGLLLLPPRRNHAIRPDGLLLATLAPPESYLDPLEFRTRALFFRGINLHESTWRTLSHLYILPLVTYSAPSHPFAVGDVNKTINECVALALARRHSVINNEPSGKR